MQEFTSSNAEFVNNFRDRTVVEFAKLSDAEKATTISEINAATADKSKGPMEILGKVAGIIGKFAGAVIVLATMLLMPGCFQDDKRAIAGAQVENRALQMYVANNRKLIESVAEWTRDMQAQTVQANFDRDVNQITGNADAAGKVDAAQVRTAVLKWDADKRAALAKIDAAIAKVYADRDTAEIPLAQMYEIRTALEKYHSAGATPEAINSAVDVIVDKISTIPLGRPAKPSTSRPIAPDAPKPVNMRIDETNPASAFVMTRTGTRADGGTRKIVTALWNP